MDSSTPRKSSPGRSIRVDWLRVSATKATIQDGYAFDPEESQFELETPSSHELPAPLEDTFQ